LFLSGRRYPFVSVVVGAAVLIVGVVLGKALLGLVGGVVLAFGCYRSFTALRHRGVTGGRRDGGGALR